MNIISRIFGARAAASIIRLASAPPEVMAKTAVDPVEIYWNRGLCRLGFGDIEDGLSDYEIRWIWEDFPSAKRVFSSPLWMGEDLEG